MRTSVFILLTFLIVYKVNALSYKQSDFSTQKKLHIDIYFESLCPGCKEFITTQLAPAYVTFKNYIEVVLTPFGHSKSKRNGSATVFECQHGPKECFVNRLQSCVLDILNDDQDKKVDFVTCQMQANADPTGQNCTKSLNIPYADVLECVIGPKGIDLQLDAEKKTKVIADEITSKSGRFGVPAVIFDNVYSESDENEALDDFAKIICDKLKKSDKKPSIELIESCANPQILFNSID